MRKMPEQLEEDSMEWTTPAFEEINLNCEINSYASAQI
jgi:coenzyme PQQ precursor peptide PqqA